MTMCAKTCGKCFKSEGNFECGDMSCETGRNNLERLRVGNLERENTELLNALRLAETCINDWLMMGGAKNTVEVMAVIQPLIKE